MKKSGIIQLIKSNRKEIIKERDNKVMARTIANAHPFYCLIQNLISAQGTKFQNFRINRMRFLQNSTLKNALSEKIKMIKNK